MFQDLIKYISNKNIAILGFGVEGISTYKFIRKHLSEKKITIIDREEIFNEKYQYLSDDSNIDIIYGEEYLDNLDIYDLIIKSPGISFKNIDTSPFEDKITSELQLFLTFFKGKTIGITGSKGKSTTSSLIYKVLEEQNSNTILLGNIGLPIFDSLDVLNEETNVVLEISSHQLEYIKKSPNISIILNVFEEHLDHYHSYERYAEAKSNIFRFQNEEDYAIYNNDNTVIKHMLEKNKPVSNKIGVSFENKDNDNYIFLKEDFVICKIKEEIKLYNINDNRKLLGNHNLFNIMFCLAVCKVLDLDIPKAIKTINNFESLPHRMEFVGEFKEVKYYNDSIATIPEATINCIEALKEVNTLIIGGMDRKIDYSKFIDYLINSNVQNIVCLPDVGLTIGDEILKNENCLKNIYKVSTMEEAVEVSKKVTPKNTICLLSPAAASYGFFSNFKERGEVFKRLVTS
jgi:UDP-N-acetylmuramoylalanine--D-glutamate ligase